MALYALADLPIDGFSRKVDGDTLSLDKPVGRDDQSGKLSEGRQAVQEDGANIVSIFRMTLISRAEKPVICSIAGLM